MRQSSPEFLEEGSPQTNRAEQNSDFTTQSDFMFGPEFVPALQKAVVKPEVE